MTRSDALAFLAKAEQYLAAAQDSFAAQRFTVAAGDAIHAGISAKDAIMTMRTGSTGKGRDHMQAVSELRLGLGDRADAPTAERSLRELLAAKPDVEYAAELYAEAKARALLRRADSLVELAAAIVRRGESGLDVQSRRS